MVNIGMDSMVITKPILFCSVQRYEHRSSFIEYVVHSPEIFGAPNCNVIGSKRYAAHVCIDQFTDLSDERINTIQTVFVNPGNFRLHKNRGSLTEDMLLSFSY
ncbi:Hypothetical predicted protein [Octopus vulgaris]|uniref:Uncharacterized protein n=1 Tax=Octopus vulgaris TaxID=6645 RepID=A0AA36BS75_OCTVU|nr:Hypothetical predicted protein [Octopus vulgaris]